MPRHFVWSAPVWQADLDAFGELRTTNVLRLLQESATRASTATGFDAAYYERTDAMWIVRRTRLEMHAAARYGDVLDVRTWIGDFRRVRSQREYEVRAADRLVARASTDWVFVDRAHGRPRRIPDEWNRTFALDAAHAPDRVPFPEASPPVDGVATARRRIELHELDALRHVNNANYVAYVEQAILDATGAAGWDLEAQIAAGGRLRPVFHDLEYLDAALYGETVTVTSWTTAQTEAEVERHTHLHRGDARRPLLHARSRFRWTSANDAPMPDGLRIVLRRP